MREFKVEQRYTDRSQKSVNYYLNEVSKLPLLTTDEEHELAIKVRNGNTEAKEKLIISNLRFVVSVAKAYQNRGIPLNDLINAGNIGLIIAADKFDPTRGFKFISYAIWHIRQQIVSEIRVNSKMIRIPSDKFDLRSKIKDTTEKFMNEEEREPTIEELHELMSHKELWNLKETLHMTKKGLVCSLSEPASSDDTTFLFEEILIDENCISPDYEITYKSSFDRVLQILDWLNPRETDIIKRFFGIGATAETKQQIAERYDLTPQAIEYILHKTLRKLRHPRFRIELMREIA